MTKYPKGSMGAADQKNKTIFKAIFTIIQIIIFVVFLNKVEFTDFAKVTAAGNTVGVICQGLSIAALWIGDELEWSAFWWMTTWLGLLAFGLACSTGLIF